MIETERSRDSFPFMKLSAELRMMIYRVALRSNEPLLLSIEREKPTAQPAKPDVEKLTQDVLAKVRARHSNGQAPPGPSETWRRSVELADERTRTVASFHEALSDMLNQQNGPYGWQSRTQRTISITPSESTSHHEDATAQANLVPNILCLNRQVYREARSVLYSENIIKLELANSIFSLNSLRQPTRSLLKHIHVSINSYHDILDGFSDLVRLALRYCWGLQSLTICLPGGWPTFPTESTPDGKRGTPNVYANAFHILRWLPRTTKVTLEGDPNPEIIKVVEQCGRAVEELDEVRTRLLRDQHPVIDRRVY